MRTVAPHTILYVVRPATGGMREHILSLVGGLDRSRFRPVVAGPLDRYWRERLARLGVEIFLLDIPDGFRPWRDLRAIKRLATLIEVLQPDLVHSHGARAGLVARLASLLAGGRPGQLLTVHNFTLQGASDSLLKGFLHWIEKALLPHTDAIIAVSGALRDDWLRRFSCPDEKVRLIYNAVELKRFTSGVDCFLIRREIGVPSRSPLMCCVARLCADKGVDVLIRAMPRVLEQFPTATAIIAGDGPERSDLTRLCRELGVQNQVRLLGYRPDIPALLAASDLFIMPSRREGLAIAVLEAMAAGKPVVATRVGGLVELLADGERGVLVPQEDPGELAAAIVGLLNDEVARKRMGINGRKFVSARFSVDSMVGETQDLYTTVLNPAHKRTTKLEGGNLPAEDVRAPEGEG